MISIIICSRKADISQKLRDNISATVGCDHEFIVVDNSGNDYTIFSAYNEGVRRAKGDILCFMHEDIAFRSTDWGQRVMQVLADDTIGCVGVIGSWFLPNREASWWLCHADVGTLTQGYTDKNGNYKTYTEGASLKQDIADVAVVDGCWFCIRTSMFDAIRFDEESYDSFHCYDIDTCMQVLQAGKRVVVCSGIEVEHQSLGDVLTTYYEQLARFYAKWEKQLPLSRGIQLTPDVASWVSDIIAGYQAAVRKNVRYEQANKASILNRVKNWVKKCKK